uniref:Disease resistance N-terminal domain-containing protein n=1 Tax=Ananas comosus var. bracteatus TaxID=296719 RepID=A0A6V7NIZ8_ANACO|nr:unnamed protein product [Ananas comosus var. bracteatus]
MTLGYDSIRDITPLGDKWKIKVRVISESVASAIIKNLVSTCSSYLEACPAAGGMQDELERLQYALPQVQAVLTAVEGGAPVMAQNKALDTWLWQLRDAVECAEDVLDELEYYELEKTVQDRDDEQQEHFQALEGLVIKQCATAVVSEFNLSYSVGISRLCKDSIPSPAQVCARWTMLSRLVIKNCKELSSLGGIQALVSLRYLELRGCDKLIEVAQLQPPFLNDVGQKNAADRFLKNGELSIDHHALLLVEPLSSLSSISHFTFSNASQLTSLPEEWLLQNHAALKFLEIWNAVSLQSLPQSMTKLCSLERFKLWNAFLIRSLPDLPTSLRTLRIMSCHAMLKERCQENIGLDWPKIAHIPDVMIRQVAHLFLIPDNAAAVRLDRNLE